MKYLVLTVNLVILILILIFFSIIETLNNIDLILMIMIFFLIIISIIFTSELNGNFLKNKKNEIYKEYYIKLLNLFYFLDYYKKLLKKKINNLFFLVNILKYILNFFKKFIISKIYNIKNILVYLYNNYLFNFYIEKFLLKKEVIKLLFKLKFKKNYFLKYYNSLIFKK